jgi:hypothetical protein
MEHFPWSKIKKTISWSATHNKVTEYHETRCKCYATGHPKAIVLTFVHNECQQGCGCVYFWGRGDKATFTRGPKTIQVNVKDGKLWNFCESNIFHIMPICNTFIECTLTKREPCKTFFFGSWFDGCNKSTGATDMKTYTNIGHEIPPHTM